MIELGFLHFIRLCRQDVSSGKKGAVVYSASCVVVLPPGQHVIRTDRAYRSNELEVQICYRPCGRYGLTALLIGSVAMCLQVAIADQLNRSASSPL